jgi:hypothetical protein
MPPQQPDGLLDFLDDGGDFSAHGSCQISGSGMALSMAGTARAARLLILDQRFVVPSAAHFCLYRKEILDFSQVPCDIS